MKITRYCDVCEVILGKLRKATGVASGTDYRGDFISWNECSNHGEYQNHLGLKREEMISFEEWFTQHGFDFDPSTGQADFPATGKKPKIWHGTPFNICETPKPEIEDLWKKMGGTVRR